jgi:hypothetical protein
VRGSRFIAAAIAVTLLAGGALAQGKLDQSGIEQGEVEEPTTIAVPDPEPEVSRTALVEVYYPETVAYLKETFPDLYQQLAEGQPYGDPTLFSQMDIAAGSTRDLKEIRQLVKGSVFVASEEEHNALIAALATLMADLQASAGEIACSDGVKNGAETLLATPFAEEFAPRVDAFSKLYLETAAANPEGVAPEVMGLNPSVFDLLFTQMALAGVPPAYVEALRNGNASGGILCTAYIRGLDVLNAVEGEQGVVLRRAVATELASF